MVREDGLSMSTATPAPRPDESPDVADVRAVAHDYIDGWYSGDVRRMDRALHSELVKRIRVDDDHDALREVTRARMLELTADGGGHASDADAQISIDDISSDIATVRVVSPDYVDYLHVDKTAHGWRIANVLFRNRS
jgi:hypothetical protein